MVRYRGMRRRLTAESNSRDVMIKTLSTESRHVFDLHDVLVLLTPADVSYELSLNFK